MSDEFEKEYARVLDILHRNGVSRAALFGSFARNEVTDDSDFDLVVDFHGRKSLFDLVGLKQELENVLHRDVDLLTYDSLHPLLKNQILSEQVVLYE